MRWSGAQWRPLPCNWSRGSSEPNRLLVTHVMQGSLSSADSWFHNPASCASAHFGIGTAGTCYQWVDTDNMSWANCNGNSYSVTVETAGYAGDPFTGPQVEVLARLLNWCHRQYPGISEWVNTHPFTGSGLSWHGLGGAAFCGHYGCPGAPRVAALPDICARARAL